jgi:hypothetical protein
MLMPASVLCGLLALIPGQCFAELRNGFDRFELLNLDMAVSNRTRRNARVAMFECNPGVDMAR